MLEDYQNKVCVVTGAASGIGKALCEKLVALGAQVYALDRNKADIEGLHQEKIRTKIQNHCLQRL